jgi:hypothetical protein|tara:strand:+ start:3487 stop:3759 length:273 start_codon:yes stop_codon:yes gene_type:complete
MIRVTGPSLANVENVIDDPQLLLFAADKLMGRNNDWPASRNRDQIPRRLLPSSAKESVLILSLDPGNYTAVARAFDGKAGTGLIEVFELE